MNNNSSHISVYITDKLRSFLILFQPYHWKSYGCWLHTKISRSFYFYSFNVATILLDQKHTSLHTSLQCLYTRCSVKKRKPSF